MEMKASGLRAYGAAILAWLIPGLGHISLGRVAQGLTLGAMVWGLFFTGVCIGGHLHLLSTLETGILPKIFWFCNIGNGILYVFASFTGIAIQDNPMLQFSDYGNVFLVASGLLNYFLMLDAFDTATGRKP